MRSVHNCRVLYDFSRPWVTHCSVQRTDIYRTTEDVDQLRIRFKKPVIFDELGYEGDIEHGWGNLTGQELVRRFGRLHAAAAMPPMEKLLLIRKISCGGPWR